MIENKKPKICVVGGGTAGWITLAYLVANMLREIHQPNDIT